MMTITRQQFADLLDGFGSAYVSSGAYEGDRTAVTVGAVARAVADEVPPVRTEGGVR